MGSVVVTAVVAELGAGISRVALVAVRLRAEAPGELEDELGVRGGGEMLVLIVDVDAGVAGAGAAEGREPRAEGTTVGAPAAAGSRSRRCKPVAGGKVARGAGTIACW
jgi:hypothetical protein